MKKILFVVNNLKIGGIEKVCYEIVSNLPSNSYKCDFLVGVNTNENQHYDHILKKYGCNIYKSVRICSKSKKKEFLKIEEKLIKRNKYDVVYSHVDFLNIWTLKVAKKMKVPTRISHVHTTLEEPSGLNKFKRNIQIKLMSFFSTDRIACSKRAGESFYGSSKFNTVYNGFNLDEFKAYKSKKSCNKNIITIGRICEQKNPLFIVNIMKYLINIDDKYHLYWIGDGNLRNETEQKINELGLSKNIHLIGASTSIHSYLEKCDIALFPSVMEGLGIAIVETQLAQCFTYYSSIVPNEADIGYGKKISLSIGEKNWAEIIDKDIKDKIFLKYGLNQAKVNRYNNKEMVKQLREMFDK